MYKWLTIMGIVCLGFMVVLLSLGYLLKENEVVTTALKEKLDQEKLLNAASKSPSKAVLTFVDNKQKINTVLNEQKQIIGSNLTCISSAQCTTVNTQFESLGCVVPINKIGASLLEKILFKYRSIKDDSHENNVKNVCEGASLKVSECKQNLCQLVE